MKDFTNLHVHTMWSILDSLIKPSDLFKKIKELGQTSVAVTEHASLSSAYDCLKYSKEAGVKLIIGSEMYFVDSLQVESNRLRHVILLAKNAQGYKNLLALSKEGYENSVTLFKKVIPRIDWNLLEKYHEGLICTTACGGGILSQLINTRKIDEARTAAKRLKSIFGDDLALEIQPHSMRRVANLYKDYEDQRFTNQQLIKIGDELGIKVIVATDAHYLTPEEHDGHDVICAIGAGQPITSGNRLKYSQDFHLMSRDEILSRLKVNLGPNRHRAEEFCDNTLYFSNMCENPAWIDPKYHRPKGVDWELPTFPVQDQPDYEDFKKWVSERGLPGKEDELYLRYWCERELDKKFPDLTEEKNKYRSRLEKELDVFSFRNLSSYMLIVADYVGWAKKEGIPVGPGRGCAAKDTLVLTKNGYLPIQDIKIGDRVYTHTGRLQTVTNTMIYDTEPGEKLLQVFSEYGAGPIAFTKDHKIFSSKSKNQKLDFDLNPIWTQLQELKKSDKVVTTFPLRNKECIKDIILTVISESEKNCSQGFKYLPFETEEFVIPAKITVDEDFAYLLGRWIGDGRFHDGVNNQGITISFQSNDVDGMNKIKNILLKFGFFASLNKSKRSKGTDLTVSNPFIFSIFSNIFCDYKRSSETKHLPLWFRQLKDDVLHALVQGVINADSSKSKNHTIPSTSSRLILELKESFLYLKIPTTVSLNNKRFRYNKPIKDVSLLTINGSTRPVVKKKIQTNEYYSNILSIKEVECDKVYDITTENDHSYLTSNFIAHNSVGGSFVGYLIGIHEADPFKYGLIFERFYNKTKTSPSDVDLDFSQSGKPRVEEYIYQKYGKENCAKVTNYMMLTPKPYARYISKAFQYGGDRKAAIAIGNAIADSIPKDIHRVTDALEKAPLFAEYANSEKYKHLSKFASLLENKPVARATHAAAIIIAGQPMHTIVPIRKDAEGVYSIEYEKERAEANGLVKMDILGLSTLDIIDNTFKLIRQRNKSLPSLPWNYDENDEKAYQLISKGDTYGIFQLGTSAGTVDLCKKMQPRSILDLAAINALTRPGVPKEFRQKFLDAKISNTTAELLHPCLERSLKPTYGIPIYDEVMLTLGEDVAGWDLNESDRLRKFIKDKGKHPEKDEQLKKDFIASTIKNGIEPKMAQKLWEELFQNFSAYLFNLSHAVEYSFISYQTAYLKAHYPLEFLVANLKFESSSNSLDSEDNVLRAKKEIRSLGVKINPPDINRSDVSYTIIDDKTVMTGFDSLKYMGKNAIPEILAKRPFTSFEDFISKIDGRKVTAPAIKALAASGCLDSFGMTRKQMFLYTDDYKKKYQVWSKKKNRSQSFDYPWVIEPEWTVAERYALERYYLGEGLSGNKFQAYAGFFNTTAPKFSEYAKIFPDPESGESFQIAPFQAQIINFFEFKVKKETSQSFGKLMAKVLLEDPWGNQMMMTIFTKEWALFKDKIKNMTGGRLKEVEPGMAIFALGSLNWYEGQLSITLKDLLKVVPPPPVPIDLKARKVTMKTIRNRKVSEEINKQELLEQIEDELIEDGFNNEGEDISEMDLLELDPDLAEMQDNEFINLDDT